MPDRIPLEKIEEHLEFFKKMYDDVRIVDPVRKQVVVHKGMSLEQTDNVCYDYWEDGKICDNCVSVRAYNKDRTFIKLEQANAVTMLVTSMPIDTESPAVIELLKNATNSMLIGEGDYNKGHMIKSMVEDMNKKVIEDPLTSLKNRRFVDERLPADVVKSTIEECPLSVIFIDVDNLKYFNDIYGHNVGDYVLKEVGKALLSCIRDNTDWAARLGGDEFLVCLNDANKNEAKIVSDRIRDNVEKIKVPADKSIKLTVSIGIHTMEDKKLTPEELIHEADKNMYASKKAKKELVGE